MVVTVHLHTILQRQTLQGPIRQVDVELQDGSTLDDLFQELNIGLDHEHLLLAVNGRVAEPAQVLIDGDIVNLMPAISGG